MIDLHTHSTFSDGTDTPRELINFALSAGITTLALTDHDSIAGWEEAKQSVRGNLSLVLGAEISCLTSDGISVHMLGLLFDGANAKMAQMLSETRDSRIPRIKKMIELLNNEGIDITMEDVLNVVADGATVGRPHLADALVARGFIASRNEAFDGLLNNDSKFYVSHLAPTPEVAIAQIKEAGGVSVIAHPFASFRGATLELDAFEPLVKAGLNGIEVNHRDQTETERLQLLDIAKGMSLVITGSSDYHGAGKLNSLGENSTDPRQWELLEAMADQRRVVKQ